MNRERAAAARSASASAATSASFFASFFAAVSAAFSAAMAAAMAAAMTAAMTAAVGIHAELCLDVDSLVAMLRSVIGLSSAVSMGGSNASLRAIDSGARDLAVFF